MTHADLLLKQHASYIRGFAEKFTNQLYGTGKYFKCFKITFSSVFRDALDLKRGESNCQTTILTQSQL